ncbi:MAG: hypothetical protein ACYC27_20175 [Armatimonadota bacterium]
MDNEIPDSISDGQVDKGVGVTVAERYLGKLCNSTFLSLWSYPCVYHDDKSGGKEVCDLLVVFHNHVIIFSDKDCIFPDTGNLINDWKKWYRRAIQKSAKQIWGAERCIRKHPDRLFLDPKCQKRFPIDLPDLSTAKFHRIVVAHSCAERCRREMDGGSLIIVSNFDGDMHHDMPFCIGQVDSSKGFIHVLDDTSLDIVMKTLDTVNDFVTYLEKKENFFNRMIGVCADGEEDLLAFYLKRMNANDEHDFVIDGNSNVAIIKGEWEEFQRNPQRLAQIEENKISYAWDELIERFNHHILTDTQYFASPIGVRNGVKIMQFMASEDRFHRRMLSKVLRDLLSRPLKKNRRSIAIYPPDSLGHPYYVFLLLNQLDYASYKNYREDRLKLLEAYCMTVKLQYQNAEDIIGIAIEPSNNKEKSEDALYLDARQWTSEQQQKAVDQRKARQLFENPNIFRYSDDEYP